MVKVRQQFRYAHTHYSANKWLTIEPVCVSICADTCPWNLATLELSQHWTEPWNTISPWQDFKEICYLYSVMHLWKKCAKKDCHVSCKQSTMRDSSLIPFDRFLLFHNYLHLSRSNEFCYINVCLRYMNDFQSFSMALLPYLLLHFHLLPYLHLWETAWRSDLMLWI